MRALLSRWGWAPNINGLGREETFVLAALSRRPLGMRSERAIARATSLSPTAVGGALRGLLFSGYVRQNRATLAEGRAVDATIWTVRFRSRAWRRVAGDVGRCVLPRRSAARSRRVPRYLAHLFWNVDVAKLDTTRDAAYIADRILRDGDAQGLAWLATVVPRHAVGAAARGRGIDSRSAALGRVLAGSA